MDLIKSAFRNEINTMSREALGEKRFWPRALKVLFVLLLIALCFQGWIKAHAQEFRQQAFEIRNSYNPNAQVELAEAYYKSIRN